MARKKGTAKYTGNKHQEAYFVCSVSFLANFPFATLHIERPTYLKFSTFLSIFCYSFVFGIFNRNSDDEYDYLINEQLLANTSKYAMCMLFALKIWRFYLSNFLSYFNNYTKKRNFKQSCRQHIWHYLLIWGIFRLCIKTNKFCCIVRARYYYHLGGRFLIFVFCMMVFCRNYEFGCELSDFFLLLPLDSLDFIQLCAGALYWFKIIE